MTPEKPAESPPDPVWATPQYKQVVDRLNATITAWTEVLNEYKDSDKGDEEMVGLLALGGAVLFTGFSIGLNIAQSLNRIAYALDHGAVDVNDMEED
jgi:hypothetical protein